MTIFNRRGPEGQASGTSNSGVVNTGTMGNVQNQPEAVGSVQHQVSVGAGAGTAAEWTRTLRELDVALTRDQDGITDPERCRILLGLIRDQRVADEGGRLAARSMLGQLGVLCGGAPGVVSLVASALALLDTATG
ncbi:MULTISPECIES: hypothetical protein [Streptomyces]|uniref:Uncharacterized protein n=1 Tax=Streptomyces plumbiresistens TaxID=511811 RepID=A0ABP7R0C3_9ACTN